MRRVRRDRHNRIITPLWKKFALVVLMLVSGYGAIALVEGEVFTAPEFTVFTLAMALIGLLFLLARREEDGDE